MPSGFRLQFCAALPWVDLLFSAPQAAPLPGTTSSFQLYISSLYSVVIDLSCNDSDFFAWQLKALM